MLQTPRFQRFTRAIAIGCALLVIPGAARLLRAQEAFPPPPAQALLAPDQLDSLVAPIALYPDSLLSQIMVASTYPLELVEADQWLQRNAGLNGPSLTQAVEQQNWDPSVQALVIFPDLMRRLTQDINWTTNLGNAFLAQQGDVMDAVQRMRERAQQAGRLASTPQQRVIDTSDGGRPVIEIEPANPNVIYIPEYDPALIWGPPVYFGYPRWWAPRPGVALVGGGFFGFGGGISIGAYFGGGWGGWGGWGWRPGWRDRTVIVNNNFIHRYNFNNRSLGNIHGTTVWNHDGFHRQGVPYPNRNLTNEYRGQARANLAPRDTPGRPGFQGNNGFGRNQAPAYGNFRGGQNQTQPGGFRGGQNQTPAGDLRGGQNQRQRGEFRGGQQNQTQQPPAGDFRGGQSQPQPGAQNQTQPGGFRGRQNQAPAGGFRSSPAPAPAVTAPAPAAANPNRERFGNREIAPSVPGRGAFGGIENGAAARVHSDHGYSSLGPARSNAGGQGNGGGFGRGPAAPARQAPAPGDGGRRR